MKFVVLVEGHMERMAVDKFFKQWLDLRLDPPVGVKVRRFQGKDHFRKECAKVSRGYLEGPDSEDIAGVIGLLDLYGPAWYPAHLTGPDGRRAWAAAELERDVGHPRFRQFFAVHEIEAWLLSEPSLFPPDFRATLEKLREPERVNFDRPPSRRLNDLYWGHGRRGYKKTTDGRDLLCRLDPAVAHAKCPALRELLDTMLEMALETGLHTRTGQLSPAAHRPRG